MDNWILETLCSSSTAGLLLLMSRVCGDKDTVHYHSPDSTRKHGRRNPARRRSQTLESSFTLLSHHPRHSSASEEQLQQQTSMPPVAWNNFRVVTIECKCYSCKVLLVGWKADGINRYCIMSESRHVVLRVLYRKIGSQQKVLRRERMDGNTFTWTHVELHALNASMIQWLQRTDVTKKALNSHKWPISNQCKIAIVKLQVKQVNQQSHAASVVIIKDCIV